MTEKIEQLIPRVVLHDETSKKWLEFTSPCQILTTRRIDEVLPLIRQIEKATRQGLFAAGFISYEAAPAFDPLLSVRDDGEFPLLWFGLFEQVKEIALPSVTSEKEGESFSWQPSVTPEEYKHCLDQIREFVAAGDTYQVNFTYRLRTKTKVNPWDIFLRIAGDDEAPLAAFIETPDWAVCSASPELFFKRNGDEIESRPMKGTASRGLWFEHDLKKRITLQESEKEQAENVMIVDMVRNDLGKIAVCGSVQVASLFETEKYPSVWQMTSTVRAQTEKSWGQILQAIFPAASITGAPKRRTMEIIANLEAVPRRIYCGTIGFLSPDGGAQFNVAIRTVLIDKKSNSAEYGVGGGIVWDSQPDKEYEECLTKTKVLKSSARDFDLLETMLWTPVAGYLLLEYHLRRLTCSAQYFGFAEDIHQIRAKLKNIAEKLSPGPHKIRLLVARQGGVQCEAIPTKADSLVFKDIVLAANPVNADNVFLYHKTTCRNVYEDALGMHPEERDVLLFNDDGQITESTVANVAAEIDGILCTPPVYCGLLPGTQRACLLDCGKLQERPISVEEILGSPQVFLLNSVRGMHKVNVRVFAGQEVQV